MSETVEPEAAAPNRRLGLIFVGLIAYDTQKLKALSANIDERNSENFQKMVILGALSLYLDFINLFLMLLRVLGKRR